MVFHVLGIVAKGYACVVAICLLFLGGLCVKHEDSRGDGTAWIMVVMAALLWPVPAVYPGLLWALSVGASLDRKINDWKNPERPNGD